MGIKSFLTTDIETKERKQDPLLQTHYFRHNYKTVKEAFLKYAETNQYVVKSINDTHHEIYVSKKNHYIIATITQINPAETGLDLKVGYETFFGLNRPKKTVLEIYTYMKSHLTFKGTGLNA
ncbi:MAG: hypothetical protein ACNA7U_07210 [Candidatus Izemoplasmataceae bacterium]|jgi:hypothetical protein|uniref:hypothetical protein n=1 Tax=Liberiplasma polymorphum TaxID=3374570 RepID=UPI003771F24F